MKNTNATHYKADARLVTIWIIALTFSCAVNITIYCLLFH